MMVAAKHNIDEEILGDDLEGYFAWLDALRESGSCNMMEAPRWLRDEFGISKKQSVDITSMWMQNFGKRSK